MPRADKYNMLNESHMIEAGEPLVQDGHLVSHCCVGMRAAVLSSSLPLHSSTSSIAEPILRGG